jgi:hypothetical protein
VLANVQAQAERLPLLELAATQSRSAIWIGPSVWERGLCFQLANLAYCIWYEKLRKLLKRWWTRGIRTHDLLIANNVNSKLRRSAAIT